MNNRLLDEFGVNNIFILHETKLIDEMRTGIISNLIEHVLTTKNFPKILICVDHPNLLKKWKEIFSSRKIIKILSHGFKNKFAKIFYEMFISKFTQNN